MKKLLSAAIFVVAALTSSLSNAAVIHYGGGVLDTDTNLYFHDVASTFGSVNYMKSQFEVGGDYYGWRYATGEELIELFNNAGAPGSSFIGEDSVSNNYNDAAAFFSSAFGKTDTWTFGSGDYTQFFYADQQPDGDHYMGRIVDRDNSGGSGDSLQLQAIFPGSNDSYNIYMGHMLVKDKDFVPSAVPVPAAAWLFGSAMVGLSGYRARRKVTSELRV